jgi:hypothetical protein
MNEHNAPVRMNRPHGCLVVLAAGLLGALIGAAIGFATWEPCVPDPNDYLPCLFGERRFDVFFGAFLGLVLGTLAGIPLVAVWPRVARSEDAERLIHEVRGDDPELAAKPRIEERQKTGSQN